MNHRRPFDYLKALIVEFERAYKNNMINMGGLLKTFYFDCRIRNLTQKTISGYGEVLKLFLQYLEKTTIPFEQVSSLTIKEFIASLQDRELSDHSINSYLKVLRIFFGFLESEGLLNGQVNPMEKIKLLRTEKKIKPVLSPQDIERILSVFDKKSFTGCRNFTMVYTFYDTMIRLSELCNIKLSDLNMIEQTMKVYGKGRKERYVFFGKKLAKYLQLYLYGFRENISGEYLFCKSDGTYLPPDQVQHIFRRYSKKAGIHFNPHLLRHSAGTQWIKNNGSPLCLQNLMGHSSFRTTQKYIHLALEDLKKEHTVHSLGDSLNYK